jgi:hypothetical protein
MKRAFCSLLLLLPAPPSRPTTIGEAELDDRPLPRH